MTVKELTWEIVQYKLSPSPEKLAALNHEVLSKPYFYLVAASGTSREVWEGGQYSVFIDQQNTLPAFLSMEEASGFAMRQGCVLAGQALVIKAGRTSLCQTVGERTKQTISNIDVYTRVPVHLSFEPKDFFEDAGRSVGAPARHLAAEGFAGVDAVRAALDTYEVNARKRLDPGGRYENIHTLIESLSQQNHLDPGELDRKLEFPDGYTRDFLSSVKNAAPSKAVLEKYLSYFGLREYLYVYKRDCMELMRSLKKRGNMDQYQLKTPPGLNAERFRLDDIQRGRDGEGVFVYRLTLSSKERQMQIVLSSPLNLVIGREYQLLDREGRTRVEDSAGGEGRPTPLPNEQELQRLVSDLEEKEAQKRRKPERTYEEQRRDSIVAYFRKQGINTQSAQAKYKDLEVEPDILDAFFKYISKKQFGSLEIQGYTARKLIRELHMDPYEAYLSLVQLRSDPQNTRQRLIYRERDPQYQKL